MSKIYTPNGKAREYSPLALNYYSGCSHRCFYCYVPRMMKVFNSSYNHSNNEYKDKMNEISTSAKKNYNTNSQVLLSFTTDPYCELDNKVMATRDVLQILYDNRIPTAILSKGGNRLLRDIDLFKKFKNNIKVGATIVVYDDNISMQYESGAPVTSERIESLRKISEVGIKTWISMEPVIIPDQSFKVVEATYNFVDHYRIGKLNGFKVLEDRYDWKQYTIDVVKYCRDRNIKFYIKKSLQEYLDRSFFLENEIDPEYLNITNSNDW